MMEMIPTIILGTICCFLIYKTYNQEQVIVTLVEAHNANAVAINKLIYGIDAITEALDEDTD